MKVCTRCGIEKELSEFGRSKARDSHNSWCKACMVAAVTAHRKAHSELARERRRCSGRPTVANLQKIPRDKTGNQEFLNRLQQMPSLPTSYLRLIWSEAPHRPEIYEELMRLLMRFDPSHQKMLATG